MSLLVPPPAVNPIILPMGRAPAPVPYTGTWYPYLFLTCRPEGELYLGLGSYIPLKGGIYRTTDYGNAWEQVLNHDDFGGEGHLPLHLMPTSTGYVAAVWHEAEAPKYWQIYKASTLDGPWTVVLGGTGYYGLWKGWPNFWRTDGGSYIWVTGQIRYPSGTRKILQLSKDGGSTWDYCFALGSDILPGQIRVNSSRTKGFYGSASMVAYGQDRYSDNPTATPGTWLHPGISARGYRFGVCWPYVVVPHITQFWFSDDNGQTGAYKDIPVGMQPDPYVYCGLDMSPHDRNRILAAPSSGSPGVSLGIWLSTDYGDSWTKVMDDLGDVIPGASFCDSVMFDPFNVDKAYAWGGLGFFRSDDRGATWKARSNGLELGQ